ncbi:hypothetical protein C2G38_2192330 [Gigaspora rosea]|uniref:Uncharacterized protein n=1 Tax=Gigaspora rosea TaxID=44941 RepID=A0A397UZ73_9GLOM|nr:hypothetical protein C2G38_2192330 [Gigaspora rosea]
MFYVHVIVEEPPNVLYETAVNIAHIINTGTFKDLLFEIGSDQFLERNVLVFGREKKDNANCVLMNNAKRLYLPKKLTRENSRDRLYNELIDLFEEKRVGWFSGIQDSKGKIFIEHLSSALCEKCWDEIVPEVFSLTIAMRKYAEHLQKSAQLTYNAHHSTTVVQLYEFIEISEFLPSERIERHRWITLAAVNEKIPQYITREMRKPLLYSLIKILNPTILNMLHRDLTGDMSACNTNSKDNTPAVNDRRHGNILYMPWFISIRDLQKSIIQRLTLRYGDPLPDSICIPSLEWIRLQFWPTNSTVNRAIKHTGRFKIKYQVQIPTFTGVRNRPSLVPLDIPNSISDLFYNGDVYVGYKDTVFESSNAIRHAAEFFQAIDQKFSNEIPPILCIYTDGGPDHRTNFGSVQVSLISLFFKGDFDMLIALRTAPYHSWANPAERIMPILNLKVALVRNVFSKENEEIFEHLNTLEDIRKLVLNENPFKCYDPVLNIDIDELYQEISYIDETLRINETTWASLKKHDKLMKFIKSHCQQRLYSFQIKKCLQPNYLNHYASFNSIYGTETNECHCPSLLLNQEEQERGSNKEDHPLYNILFVRERISCSSPIETNYYACEHGDKVQLCYWCGTENDLSELPNSLTSHYKIVYPCCNACKELGKDHFTRLEIKVGQNSKRKKYES